MDQRKFLVIILTIVGLAPATFVSAQNLTSAKKDTVKTSAANGSQASPDDFVDLLRKDIRIPKETDHRRESGVERC
jgi:hypothetical protein